MPNTYSREESKSLKLGGIAAIFVILLIAYFTIQKSAVKLSNDFDDHIIYAKFGRTDGLLPGDKVMLSGIEVGKVTKTTLDDSFHTVLTMSIDHDIEIPDDSSASIVSSSILGSKFISIEPGGSEDFLKTGDFFSYTQDAMVINELIERVVAMGKEHCTK